MDSRKAGEPQDADVTVKAKADDEIGPASALPTSLSGTPDPSKASAAPTASAGNKTPAAETEQQKRDKEAAEWENINYANAYFYKTRIWIKERPTSQQDIDDEKARLESGATGKLKTAGIYTLQGKEHIRIVLEENKDGSFSATPYGAPKNEKEFKQCYGAAMDLLASGRGASTIKVNFKEGHDWSKDKYGRDYAVSSFEKLIRMAEKRGLAMEMKPGAQALLDSMPMNDPRRIRIQDGLAELRKNQARNNVISGKDVSVLPGITKELNGFEMKQAEKDTLSNLTGGQKLDAIETEMKKVEEQAQKLEKAREALDKAVTGLNDLVGKDLKQVLKKQDFTGHLDKDAKYDKISKQVERFDERVNERDKPAIDELRKAIDARQAELDQRQKFLADELAKAKLEAPAAAEPVKPAGVTEPTAVPGVDSAAKAAVAGIGDLAEPSASSAPSIAKTEPSKDPAPKVDADKSAEKRDEKIKELEGKVKGLEDKLKGGVANEADAKKKESDLAQKIEDNKQKASHGRKLNH